MACDSLLVVTEIRQALAEAKSLDDVVAIRDRSDAIRRLLKIQGESLAAQNEMAEVTVRAEVLLGESVAKMEKKKGHRFGGSPRQPPALSEIGINKKQSHRWQTMAAAKKQITRLLGEANDAGKDFTRAMVYREGRRILKGDEQPKIRDSASHIGALRRYVFNLFDDHTELRSVLPCVLREIADELTGFMELNDGSSRRKREGSASAA